MSRPITVEFAADEKPITQAFKNIGDAASKADTELKDLGASSKKAGDGLDNMADKADNVDTRAMGFRDTLTGVQDGLAGLRGEGENTMENLLLLGTGVGDLASGFANFLIPQLGAAVTWLASTTVGTWALTAAKTAWTAVTTALTAAWTALNVVMRANPILFVVGLILALYLAFRILWDRSEGFRNFFINMWNGIKSVVGNVVNWIKSAWNGLMDFFSKLPGRITGFFGNLASGIKGIFKSVVNGVIDLLNGGISVINGLIHGINNVSGLIGIPAIPDIPRIPRLHTGGTVPGPLGSEQLAVLKAGEHVSARGQGGGNTMTFVNDGDSMLATLIMKMIRNGDIVIS